MFLLYALAAIYLTFFMSTPEVFAYHMHPSLECVILAVIDLCNTFCAAP